MPDVEIDEVLTFKMFGTVKPTLVTVPLPVPAPIAVLKFVSSNNSTVLSALILINLIAPGDDTVNKEAPVVVAPKFIIAVVAVDAPVPPLAIATIPVTLEALPLTSPVRFAVIVLALKLPDESLKTIVLVEFELVALLSTVKVTLLEVLAEKLAEPESPLPETARVNVPFLISPETAIVSVVVGNVKVLLEGVADAISKVVPLDVPLNLNPELPIVEVLIVEVLIVEVLIVGEFIVGDVSVLFVKVWLPVKVTTVLFMENDVPVKVRPVPFVYVVFTVEILKLG